MKPNEVPRVPREELEQRAEEPIREAAGRIAVRGLPDGVALHDLLQLGFDAVPGLIDRYDPKLGTFEEWVRICVMERMEKEVREKKKLARNAGAGELVVADPEEAEGPGYVTFDEELAHRKRATARTIAESSPAPGTVAAKVELLRQTVYTTLTPAAMGDVMASLITSAANGNLKAATILLDLVVPKGPTSVQVGPNVNVETGKRGRGRPRKSITIPVEPEPDDKVDDDEEDE